MKCTEAIRDRDVTHNDTLTLFFAHIGALLSHSESNRVVEKSVSAAMRNISKSINYYSCHAHTQNGLQLKSLIMLSLSGCFPKDS